MREKIAEFRIVTPILWVIANEQRISSKAVIFMRNKDSVVQQDQKVFTLVDNDPRNGPANIFKIWLAKDIFFIKPLKFFSGIFTSAKIRADDLAAPEENCFAGIQDHCDMHAV